MDKNKIQETSEHLDNNLPEYEDAEGRKHLPDIPIEELVVEIEDDRIAELVERKPTHSTLSSFLRKRSQE